MSANLNLAELLKRKFPNPFEHQRQPMDERLPDGRSSIGLQQQSPPTANPTPRAPLSPAMQRAQLGVPNGDVIAALKEAKDTPLEDRRVEAHPPPQVRMGTDTSGMSDLERQQAKIDLRRRSAPSSQVRDTGDFLEEGPPEQSPSRVKNALLGLLLGTAQGGIGGGIAGATVGAVKPELIQQLRRDQQVGHDSQQLGQQLVLEDKRADIAKEQAQTQTELMKPQLEQEKAKRDSDYRNNQLKIQREAESGRITRDQAAQQQRELDRRQRADDKKLDRESRERLGGGRGLETPASISERERKAQAARDEYNGLVKEEEKAGAEKNRLYDVLKTVKENSAYPKEDLEAAQRDADEADKIYKSYTDKKTEALRRIRENSGDSTAPPPSGQKWSAAKWKAANPKGDVEAAKKAAALKGYEVTQ